MSELTRKEHIARCKKRALEYVKIGDLKSAFASMASDLNEHPETTDHAGLEIGLAMLMAGHLETAEKMREFIEGFH